MASATPLARYNAKRDFGKTPEPAGKAARRKKALSFVIQKHWASHLHYDFRLELDGVLLSWAVPKGPSLDPSQKRMAIHVEDHPVSYGSFEGSIPAGQYGAGTVIVWDNGTWEPVGDARAGIAAGKLQFRLHGQKLGGLWELVRIAKPGDRQEPWILFKKRDDQARSVKDFDVIVALPDSVIEKPLGPRETTSLPVEGAVKASLPESLSPQLATLAKSAPVGDGWSVEAKFDGYRILARIERGRVRLFTRNGHDWTDRLATLAKAVEGLGVQSAWLDGEIVVPKADGGQDFNALQNAIDRSSNEGIVYFVFDAPFFEGQDLRRVALRDRRALLKALFERVDDPRVRFFVRYSADFEAKAEDVLAAACRMKLEGVIVKRLDSHYVSTRSDAWLKLKCTMRQEFVIGGFTERKGAAMEVGALLLGVHDDDGRLRYAGMVGTGWKPAMGKELRAKLAAIEVDRTPFETGSTKQSRWSRRTPGQEHWVGPTLVAEVAFAEWTPDGHVRHASFQGLRADKPAEAITRERAAEPSSVKPVAKKADQSMKITHPERVIDTSTGITKLDLIRYYESVADLILPHLKGRPVSLVRGPSGVDGQLFFQKHPETRIAHVKELDPALWPDHAALMEIDSVDALLSATQMNTIEFHTWNALSKKIDQPDRMIFDLDPGEGTSWAHIQEAAVLTRALLTELGLVSFIKTSGGKGLHVVVPLTPRAGWDVVKGFSQAVVQHLATTIPERFVARSGAANRVGKLFVDYLRNGHGATTAVAFSARARPGMGVSIPVAWDDLPGLKSGAQWTVATAREYLSFQKADPWADYAKTKQTLTAPMKRLGYVAPSTQKT